MVIFIDLRPSMKDTPCEEVGPFFAYWNTVVDQFVSIGGDMAWSSWSQLLDSIKSVADGRCVLLYGSGSEKPRASAVDMVSRLRSVTPEWVMLLGRKEKK